MEWTENAKKYYEKMFPGRESELAATDPEFAERIFDFAFDEVVNEDEQQLDDRTRFLVILATLVGCQGGADLFREMAKAALNFGVTPVEIREIVYQGTAYLGFGRVYPVLKAMDEVFEEEGIALPLENQAHTTLADRREAGTQVQVDIFGDGMKDFWKSGPEDSRHINRWLAANCFGDYYTRGGLDLREREMVTFCYIAAQGGCEAQLTAHAGGNFAVGNDRAFLIKVISNALPYIGYPRSLNALACVNKAAEAK